MIARLSLLNSLPRLASMAPFLCLMVAQWECPDMAPPSERGNRCVAKGWILPATRIRTRSGMTHLRIQTLQLVLQSLVVVVRFALLFGFKKALGAPPGGPGLVSLSLA